MAESTVRIPFEEFYAKYYDQVYWYIFKKINHVENAQDMAGDIFCICYNKYEEYDPSRSSLGTWLYVIVNNKLKNYYRDRKVHSALEDVSDELVSTSDDYISKAMLIEEVRDVIAEAIAQLPERNQIIVLLKFFGSRQSDEIASILNMSAVNVRVILSRSLKKIQEYMVKKGWNGEL